ncbi:hypothetical protein F4776DRAFT_547946 [Hypoxylon sp. NC0597]|nr:hypothetical protein F4776DRAFT_547946 [Hypoxylon sp. NC0597]
MRYHRSRNLHRQPCPLPSLPTYAYITIHPRYTINQMSSITGGSPARPLSIHLSGPQLIINYTIMYTTRRSYITLPTLPGPLQHRIAFRTTPELRGVTIRGWQTGGDQAPITPLLTLDLHRSTQGSADGAIICFALPYPARTASSSKRRETYVSKVGGLRSSAYIPIHNLGIVLYGSTGRKGLGRPVPLDLNPEGKSCKIKLGFYSTIRYTIFAFPSRRQSAYGPSIPRVWVLRYTGKAERTSLVYYMNCPTAHIPNPITPLMRYHFSLSCIARSRKGMNVFVTSCPTYLTLAKSRT